eukprot:318513-Prymnesium_polylepis.2
MLRYHGNHPLGGRLLSRQSSCAGGRAGASCRVRATCPRTRTPTRCSCLFDNWLYLCTHVTWQDFSRARSRARARTRARARHSRLRPHLRLCPPGPQTTPPHHTRAPALAPTAIPQTHTHTRL